MHFLKRLTFREGSKKIHGKIHKHGERNEMKNGVYTRRILAQFIHLSVISLFLPQGSFLSHSFQTIFKREKKPTFASYKGMFSSRPQKRCSPIKNKQQKTKNTSRGSERAIFTSIEEKSGYGGFFFALYHFTECLRGCHIYSLPYSVLSRFNI